MDDMLKIEDAALRLGGRVLFRNFGLELKPGEWVCITGESGCGKTSLLRMVLGFLPLDGGRIWVCGDELSARTVERIRQQTAYVPQRILTTAESVEEMVRMPFELKANRETKLDEEEMFRVWGLLGLERSLFRRKAGQLSGGQQQRVVLSAAALLGKRLWLADEPTSALDEDSVGRVAALFRDAASKGTAVLTVSHNRAFMEVCDRVIRL